MDSCIYEYGINTHICEHFVRGVCQSNANCDKFHFPLPFLWQMDMSSFGGGILNLSPELSYQIESSFCRPEFGAVHLQQPLMVNSSLTLNDVCINLDLMTAFINHPLCNVTVAVNRISTASYAMVLSADPEALACQNSYYTQWRWYYYDSADGSWKAFGVASLIPDQQTLETKFCWPHRQIEYRFEGAEGMNYVIEFVRTMGTMKLISSLLSRPNDSEPFGWPIRRRPLLAEHGVCPSWLSIKSQPFILTFPTHWTPLAILKGYEVIRLSQESEEFKTVCNTFLMSGSTKYWLSLKRKVRDIFRVQNPFLWQKFETKRLYMKAHGNFNEKLLFHGTQTEAVVKGICHHNFDLRCNGVNGVLYGKGVYFATTASCSDKYAFRASNRTNWMFLARVLVGKSTIGNRELARPPPLDMCQPYGELYDSCVDIMDDPKLYVIFDSDQCYPEYIIGYMDIRDPD